MRIRTSYALAASIAAVATIGCSSQSVSAGTSGDARLRARPGEVTSPARTTGIQKLNISTLRDGVLYVPRNVKTPAPLLLMLHGSGASGEAILHRVQPLADAVGAIVVAPDAREYTWDAALGTVRADGAALSRMGSDVAYIDKALSLVFSRYAIDRHRIAIGGFSDGASYALSLGLTNGDLFSHVIAFSPGFVRLKSTTGEPRVFLSHGRSDQVLPIEKCGRPIAAALTRSGYDVEYIEFDGQHTVPQVIAERALVSWFAGPGAG